MLKNIKIGKLIRTNLCASLVLINAAILLVFFFPTSDDDKALATASLLADKANVAAKNLVVENFQNSLPYNQGWQHKETTSHFYTDEGIIPTIQIDARTGVVTTVVIYQKKTYIFRSRPTINGQPLTQPPSTGTIRWICCPTEKNDNDTDLLSDCCK